MGDVLRSFAQWSRASLSVLSKSRGPKTGGTKKTERPGWLDRNVSYCHCWYDQAHQTLATHFSTITGLTPRQCSALRDGRSIISSSSPDCGMSGVVSSTPKKFANLRCRVRLGLWSKFAGWSGGGFALDSSKSHPIVTLKWSEGPSSRFFGGFSSI